MNRGDHGGFREHPISALASSGKILRPPDARESRKGEKYATPVDGAFSPNKFQL